MKSMQAWTARRSIWVPEFKFAYDEHKPALMGYQFAALRGHGYVVAVFKDGECVGYLDSVDWGYRNARDMLETIPNSFID